MNKDELQFSSLSLSEMIEEDSDFFPLLSQEDEDKIDKEETPKVLPLLPLRNTVLFPGVIIPITIGRDRSIKLVKDTYKGNRTIGVLAQKDPTIEIPEIKDLHNIGTVAHILKILECLMVILLQLFKEEKDLKLKNLFKKNHTLRQKLIG